MSVLGDKSPFKKLFNRIPDYTFYRPLVVLVFLTFQHLHLTNYNHSLFIVFSLDMLVNIKDTVVMILPLERFT